ncbi:uncharacterized protein LOC120666322 isoform X2 [Panicum virgatum]|uniref:uncharacterized protein LOC120666322 isoform X2 n=1 Tax=Panicum virgatum TaxID=38727 RepID=UPI0019D50429|nr:uncharacterized protein LOC120666322 isoform X2 [Panicum virgatum]
MTPERRRCGGTRPRWCGGGSADLALPKIVVARGRVACDDGRAADGAGAGHDPHDGALTWLMCRRPCSLQAPHWPGTIEARPPHQATVRRLPSSIPASTARPHSRGDGRGDSPTYPIDLGPPGGVLAFAPSCSGWVAGAPRRPMLHGA